MLQKTIAYTDFNGNEQTETLYFNLTKAELVEMQFSHAEGFDEWLKQIAATNNTQEILTVFKKVINSSYGERSADGKRFIKSPEFADAFYQTAAYDELFMELIQDADKMAQFMNSLVPANLAEEARQIAEKKAAEEGKTPSEIARQRSEASLHGHQTPAVPQSSVVVETPMTQPSFARESFNDSTIDPEYAEYLRTKAAKQ
jgi:hypothetical protein